MNPAIKGTIAFGSFVGAGGTAYGIYNAMQPTPEKVKTYAEELEGTLLTAKDDSQKSNWESRLTSLQGVSAINKLVTGLQGLKEKKNNVEQWKELRTWCQNIVKTPSKDKEDQEFQNIQSYCTFSVKEKLGNNVISEDGNSGTKWTTAHGKLENIANLNEALTAAKNTKDGNEGTKVKEWCVAKYSEPFKGEKDSDFVLAKLVCVSE